MIAIDAFEEKPAQALHLIGADACQHLLADEFEIGSNLLRAQIAHVQLGGLGSFEKKGAVARDRASADEPAAFSREVPAKARSRFGERRRLGAAAILEGEHLVGAQDEPARRAPRDDERLFRREMPRDRAGQGASPRFPCFDGSLVDIRHGRLGLDARPAAMQQAPASKATRGEDQIFSASPNRA